MRRAMGEIEGIAEERLGDWVSVSETYAPEWAHPYMNIREIAANVFTAQPAPQAETPRDNDESETR